MRVVDIRAQHRSPWTLQPCSYTEQRDTPAYAWDEQVHCESSCRNTSVLMLLWSVDQGPAATAELAALVHGVAGLLGLLLTPDAPPAAEAQLSSIDRSAAALPMLTHIKAMFQEMLRANRHEAISTAACLCAQKQCPDLMT